MKIGYFLKNIGVSGGVKVMLQHVEMLRESGYNVALYTQQIKDAWDLKEIPTVICKEDLSDLSDREIIVGSVYHDVRKLYGRGKGKIVHLCQGYEPIDYLARITQESITEKYQRKGLFSFAERYFDTLKFKKRIKEIESVYSLPTYKAAVSLHLTELLSKRYGQKCALIQNGIDLKTFFPPRERAWGKSGKVRILSTGSMNVGFKGIPDTLDAIRILKDKGVNIELVRVAPSPPSKGEQESGLVADYYYGLKEHQMAELYRSVDVYISSSLEGEGFGLPAIEALASGVPSVLTRIQSYSNFSENKDFAYFVPTHSPEKIAEGVQTFIEDSRFRDRCVEKGFEVARRYSLDRMKEHLLDFIESLRS